MANDDKGGRGSGCLSVAMAGSVIALLSLLWTMFNVDYMRYAACSEPRIQDGTSRIDYCRGFKPVTAAEAQEFYDEYLGRASGAEPDRAWGMLSEQERGESDVERFESDWAGTLWAERVGVATPTDVRNRYTLQYRQFSGESNEVPRGQIVYFNQEVEFTDGGSGVLIADRSPVERDATYPSDYPWLELVRDATTYRLPGPDQQPVEKWPAGGGFRMLCSTEVGDEWWARTPLGWVSRDDLMDTPASILCEAHHAQQVLQGRSGSVVVTTDQGE